LISGGRGGVFGLIFGRGGGGGVAVGAGISVAGCINSTTSNFSAVCIVCGKTMGLKRSKPRVTNCPTALRPSGPTAISGLAKVSKRAALLLLIAPSPVRGVGLLRFSSTLWRNGIDFDATIPVGGVEVLLLGLAARPGAVEVILLRPSPLGARGF